MTNKISRLYSVYLCISFQNKIYMEPQNSKNPNNFKLPSIHQLRRMYIKLTHFKLVAITAASSSTPIFLDLLEM